MSFSLVYHLDVSIEILNFGKYSSAVFTCKLLPGFRQGRWCRHFGKMQTIWIFRLYYGLRFFLALRRVLLVPV